MILQKATFVYKRFSRWSEIPLFLMTQGKKKNWRIAALSWRKALPIITRSLLILSIIIFWCWNWKLLLAIVVGIGLMLSVYLAQSSYWRRYWSIFKRLFTGYNRRLTLAVSSGSLGAFITYMTASIWADTENRWLATGSILQGLGTLTTLFLLGWHLWGKQSHQQETKFNELSEDLAAPDPLKRLMAVRQLTTLVLSNKLPAKYYGWLIEYYHLMLSQSQEKLVREALLDALQALDVNFLRDSKTQLNPIPLNLSRSRKPVYKF